MKIKLKKSPTADTRSATKPVTKAQLMASSMQHVHDVQEAIYWMQKQLETVAYLHDRTKFSEGKQFHKDFAAKQSGRMKDFVKESKWYKLHVTKERHHFNVHCPEDINLFDVLEQLADIVMAGMARTGTVYVDPVKPEVLMRAYHNTVELLMSQVEVGE